MARSIAGAKHCVPTSRRVESNVRKIRLCQNTLPMSSGLFSPLRRPMRICAPEQNPRINMNTAMKKMPPSAEAPNSTSPTRPKKAVSVMPTSCSTTELSTNGKAIFQISRYE